MFARSRREMLTPIETATTAIGSASTNRADVFDFPHQHRSQHAHGGKWCDDQPPELRRYVLRHRQTVCKAAA